MSDLCTVNQYPVPVEKLLGLLFLVSAELYFHEKKSLTWAPSTWISNPSPSENP